MMSRKQRAKPQQRPTRIAWEWVKSGILWSHHTGSERGDIIVFVGYHDPVPLDLVKRIVGVPGDTLEMRGAVLALNGESLAEDYASHVASYADHADPSMRWQVEHLASPFLI